MELPTGAAGKKICKWNKAQYWGSFMNSIALGDGALGRVLPTLLQAHMIAEV